MSSLLILKDQSILFREISETITTIIGYKKLWYNFAVRVSLETIVKSVTARSKRINWHFWELEFLEKIQIGKIQNWLLISPFNLAFHWPKVFIDAGEDFHSNTFTLQACCFDSNVSGQFEFCRAGISLISMSQSTGLSLFSPSRLLLWDQSPENQHTSTRLPSNSPKSERWTGSLNKGRQHYNFWISIITW